MGVEDSTESGTIRIARVSITYSFGDPAGWTFRTKVTDP